jgi:uncharacterized membrane protein required for colicin V production
LTVAWPDLIIGGITIWFAFMGFKKGFVAEIAGIVAVVVAVVAAFRYGGSLDGIVTGFTGLTNGSAHALGVVLFAIGAYIVVKLIAWLLGRIARLPVIGLVNGAAGAAIGAFKALFATFVVLYVALFLPLPPDLRSDLHRSALVGLVTQPDRAIDDAIHGLMPWFLQPLAEPLFDQHHL